MNTANIQHDKSKKQQLTIPLLETLISLASRIPCSQPFYFSCHSAVFASPPVPNSSSADIQGCLLGPRHELHITYPKLNLRFLLKFTAFPVFPTSVNGLSNLSAAQTRKVILDSFSLYFLHINQVHKFCLQTLSQTYSLSFSTSSTTLIQATNPHEDQCNRLLTSLNAFSLTPFQTIHSQPDWTF